MKVVRGQYRFSVDNGRVAPDQNFKSGTESGRFPCEIKWPLSCQHAELRDPEFSGKTLFSQASPLSITSPCLPPRLILEQGMPGKMPGKMPGQTGQYGNISICLAQPPSRGCSLLLRCRHFASVVRPFRES